MKGKEETKKNERERQAKKEGEKEIVWFITEMSYLGPGKAVIPIKRM